MTNKSTLTIGIPTYNGSAYIRDALDSVLKQISGELVSRVDILISDNASTDKTQEIVRAYQENNIVPIQYSRNDINLGYDKNVDMLFKKASGQYVWMLADDDSLKEGALLGVLKLLDEYPTLKAILVNFDQYDRKLERIVDLVELPEEMFCNNAEAFLRNANARYNLLSSLIINKAAWIDEDLTFGFGSNFIHMHALFRIILRGDSYIVKDSLVNMRMGSENFVTNGDSLLSLALDSGLLIRSMKKMGHSPEVIQWLLGDVRRYIYNTITIAKLSGINNKWIAVKRLIAVHNSPVLWLKWFPVIYCPDPIFKKLYHFKKAVSSKTRIIERKLKGLFITPK